MKLWICGQLRSYSKAKGSVWDFQGAFSTKKKAEKACRNEKYFIFSVKVDQELSDTQVDAKDAVYPKAI